MKLSEIIREMQFTLEKKGDLEVQVVVCGSPPESGPRSLTYYCGNSENRETFLGTEPKSEEDKS